MTGVHIAVLGGGRSGLAVAKAARSLGALPTVYDQKPALELEAAAAELQKESIRLRSNFEGPFSSKETDILVTSPGVDSRSPLVQDAVRQGIEIISEIEFAYRIAKAPIVAITGTNGKSTTTLMTWLCLDGALGSGRAYLCGNIYGSGYAETPLTEAAAAANANDVLVAEVSSFQLEWVRKFKPRCAAITNITPDHLNRYDSFDDYVATKKRVYQVMGAEDTYVHHKDPMTTPSAGEPFRAIETDWDERKIRLPKGSIQTRDMPFAEVYNLRNAAMAATLAFSFAELGGAYRFDKVGSPDTRLKTQDMTLNAQRIQSALSSFHGLGHRMEPVGSRGGIKLINNSMCTNPAAIVASSGSVRAHQHLLIGGQMKDLPFDPVKDYLEKAKHDVYLFGSDAACINSQLGGVYHVYKSMEDAFWAAIDAAKAGDVVMLAPGCASTDQFRDFRARGDEFKRLAKEWLDHDKIIAR